jgi:sugar lactone lactonase YvrE
MLKFVCVAALASALAACGGGGGSAPPPVPAPVPVPVPVPTPVPTPVPVPNLAPDADGVLFGVSPAGEVPLAEARFTYPEDVLEAEDGTLYVSDTLSHVIRRVKDGVVTVFAGTFAAGFNGDGQKLATELNTPTAMQFTQDGKFLVFSDSGNNLIRKIDLGSGSVSTIAGKPGDNRLPVNHAAALNNPIGFSAALRWDTVGNLFFPATSEIQSDVTGGMYYIDPQGLLHQKEIAGVGPIVAVRDIHIESGYFDLMKDANFFRVYDNGTVKQRTLESASGRGIASAGATTLVASNSTLLSLDADLNSTVVASGFANLTSVRKVKQGYLLTDSDLGVLYRFENGVKTQISGTAPSSFGALISVVKYGASSVLILDNQRPRIFLMDLSTGKATLWAGTGVQGWADPKLDKLATNFYYPNGLAVDAAKNVYVVEQHHILKITPAGGVSIFAGGEQAGDADGAQGEGRFRSPGSIAFDASGNLIVADTYNNKVRRIAPDGAVLTIAGNGQVSLPSFDVPARQSGLNHPLAVALMTDGALLIADGWNNAVYKLGADGVLQPFAGKPNRTGYQGTGTYSGDGGAAREAGMNTPGGIIVRGNTVYITDSFNHRLRAVGPDGIIRTIAGSVQGFMPGGKLLSFPREIAVVGNQLLVADTGNRNIVRYRLPE